MNGNSKARNSVVRIIHPKGDFSLSAGEKRHSLFYWTMKKGREIGPNFIDRNGEMECYGIDYYPLNDGIVYREPNLTE